MKAWVGSIDYFKPNDYHKKEEIFETSPNIKKGGCSGKKERDEKKKGDCCKERENKIKDF